MSSEEYKKNPSTCNFRYFLCSSKKMHDHKLWNSKEVTKNHVTKSSIQFLQLYTFKWPFVFTQRFLCFSYFLKGFLLHSFIFFKILRCELQDEAYEQYLRNKNFTIFLLSSQYMDSFSHWYYFFFFFLNILFILVIRFFPKMRSLMHFIQ